MEGGVVLSGDDANAVLTANTNIRVKADILTVVFMAFIFLIRLS